MKIISNKENKLDLILFCIFTLVILTPVWCYDYLAMVDLPQHLSQISNGLGILNNNNTIKSIYHINPYTPYLTTNIFLLLIAKVTSPIVSIKLAISTYLVITPLVCRLLLKTYNKDKSLSLLCFPFLYGVAFNWGFVTFLFTFSIAIVWLLYFIKNENENEKIKAYHIIISFVLAMGHAIAWGLIMYYILIIKLHRTQFSLKSILSFILISTPLLMIISWSLYISLYEPSSSDVSGIIWGGLLYKLFVFIFGNLATNDLLLGFISISLTYYTCRSHLIVSSEYSLGHSLIISTVILFILSPTLLLSTAFFSDRLLIFLPALIPLMFDGIRNRKIYYIIITLALFLTITSKNNQNMILNKDKDKDDFYNVTESMKENSTVFYIASEDDMGYYEFSVLPIPYFLHYAHWLNKDKYFFIDFDFSYFHTVMIRKNIKSDINSLVSHHYKSIYWEDYSHYDYIIIRNCKLSDNEFENVHQKHIISNNCWHLLGHRNQ